MEGTEYNSIKKYMEELLLMNPTRRGLTPIHRTGRRSFQIVFPNKIRRLRANGSSEYYTSKKLPIIDATGKQIAGAAGGAAVTVVVPKMLKLDGWKDVAASAAVAVVGGSVLKRADKEAGEAFLYTGLGITGLKVVRELIKATKGKTIRRKTRRSLNDIDNVDDLTDAELDKLLSPEQGTDKHLRTGQGVLDDNDLLGAIDDLGQDVILS